MAAYKESHTIGVDLESGGRVEFDCLVTLDWCRAEGDGWNSPRIPAHYEADGVEVVGVTWYHPDGSDSTFECQPKSILAILSEAFIERHVAVSEIDDLVNQPA